MRRVALGLLLLAGLAGCRSAQSFPSGASRLTFTGTLVNREGSPVASATLLLLPEGTLLLDVAGEEASAANPVARTDAAGRFSIGADAKRFHGSRSFHVYWIGPTDRFLAVTDRAGKPLILEPGQSGELGAVVAGDR